jgi:hypothetical protein
MATAINHLHRHEVVHRDLKPSNVLVRTLQPLDLVLADFGIASVLGQESRRFTTGNRTIAYAAPETAAGEISQAADWWSVGIMLIEMLTGRHPFAGGESGELMNDHVIMSRLFQVPVDSLVEGVVDPWRTLCRGLLRRQAKNRWAAKEIERWFGGDPTLRVTDEAAFGAAPHHPPFFFAGQKYQVLPEIAKAFRANWPEARKVVERGHLLDWVKDDLRDNEWRQFLSDLDKDCPDLDERVFRITLKADPSAVPIFHGYGLDPAGLFRLANDAIAGAKIAEVTLTRLFDQSILQAVTTETNVAAYGLLEDRWAAQLDIYKSQAGAVVRGGAPETAITQASIRARATMLLSVLPVGETYIGELRKLAQKHAKPELRDCDWFRALGDPQRATAPTAFLITLLAPHAEAPARAVQKRREDERAAQEAAERQRLEAIANAKAIENYMTEVWQCIADVRHLLGGPHFDWRFPPDRERLYPIGGFRKDDVDRLARYIDGSPCSIVEAGEERIARAKQRIAKVRELTSNDKVTVRDEFMNFSRKSDFKIMIHECSVSHTQNQLNGEQARLDQLKRQGSRLFEEARLEYQRQSSKRFFRDYSAAIRMLEAAVDRGVFEARLLLEALRKKNH